MDWGLVAALAALLVPVALFAPALLQDTKPRKGPA